MKYILSVDGGGTKLNAILLDEHMNLVGKGTSGGINTTQTPPEDVLLHVQECLDQVFAGGTPAKLDAVYAVFVGDILVLRRELEKRVEVCSFHVYTEPSGALLAGSVTDRGLVALSGTGSDMFYYSPEVQYMVGGKGPIAGDEGSGAWMGQKVVQAVMHHCDGWGEPTQMTSMLMELWDCPNDPWKIVYTIGHSNAPYCKMASLTRLLGRAAREGDAVALRIIREAGELLAEQMLSLIRRLDVTPIPTEITLCGGAWKTHPAMLESFLKRLRQVHPQMTVSKPLFEHVCFGAVRWLMDHGVQRQEIIRLLSERLPDYTNKQ